LKEVKVGEGLRRSVGCSAGCAASAKALARSEAMLLLLC
jgi:hypothetical protein